MGVKSMERNMPKNAFAMTHKCKDLQMCTVIYEDSQMCGSILAQMQSKTI